MTRNRIWIYLGTISALFLLAGGWYASAFIQSARAPVTVIPREYLRMDGQTQATPFPNAPVVTPVLSGEHHLLDAQTQVALDQRARVAGAVFDGERALEDVKTQVAFGPRVPGSESHAKALNWMRDELASAGWQVKTQSVTAMGHPIQNLIAARSDQAPLIILGAHYDSRLRADRDPHPGRRIQPVPGANDGASGVAVLLELARTLPRDMAPVWIVLFDAEDNGGIAGWDWLLGSRAFVSSMKLAPKEMVLVDMVGDPELAIPMEGYSNSALSKSIWDTAARLGHAGVFVPGVKYTIEDDHLPFVEAGIPAVDIIDLDYKYWHTTADTPEHVSAQSLQLVGEVLETWLVQHSDSGN